MRRIKVAVLAQELDGSSMVRCYSPLNFLMQRGLVEILPRLHCFLADVVVFQRYVCNPDHLQLMELLQSHGIKTVIDLDDYLLEVPDYNPVAANYRKPEVKNVIKKMLRKADALFVSTPYLKDKYSHFNNNIHILPNGLDSEIWQQVQPDEDGPVRIGFAGSDSHLGDFEVIRSVLPSILDKHPKVRLSFLGPVSRWLHEELQPYDSRIRYLDFVPLSQYYRTLVGRKLTIGIAPLVNNSFNEARSNLKFLEYSAVGAVTVASPVGSFRSLTSGVNAVLPTGKDEWFQAVSKLIENKEFRSKVLEGALEESQKFDLEVTAPDYLNSLQSLGVDFSRRAYRLPYIPTGQTSRSVTIVIPIHNSLSEVQSCVDSLRPQLSSSRQLILVDDASTEPGMATWLDFQASQPNTQLLRKKIKKGFVSSCNEGSAARKPGSDVLLLNSDTLVYPGLIDRLQKSSYSNPKIGTVTAVSNNGSIASVPYLSDSQTIINDAELVVAPTSVGHCLLIKDEVIRKFGLFDEAYSPGYGEENDLSLRIRPEYQSVLDTGCFVWHKGSSSFGSSEKNALISNHLQIVNKKFPTYPFEVSCFQYADPLRTSRTERISRTSDPRPRVLHIAHSYETVAGTEKHIKDLSRSIEKDFISFAAAPGLNDSLLNYQDEVLLGSRMYPKVPWPITPTIVPFAEQSVSDLLLETRPALIHLHHFLGHPLNVLDKLTDLSIPVVISIHDYYSVCPDYTLKDCPGTDKCDSCFSTLFPGGHPDYQVNRRKAIYHSLSKASAIIAPSQFAADKILEVYPGLNIQVIPHGIRQVQRLDQPRKPGPIRFGFVGNMVPQKGIETLLRAWKNISHLCNSSLHLFGGYSTIEYIEGSEKHRITYHGRYQTSDLPEIFDQIDVGVVPSEFPETFCLVLEEMLSASLPVLASNIGALSERVNESNGWFAQPKDINSWQKMLLQVSNSNISERPLVCSPTRTLEQMGASYSEVYRHLISHRIQSPATLNVIQ